MAFTLPNFNVNANVFSGLAFRLYPPGTQRLVTLCNLSLGRRVYSGPDVGPINLPGSGSGIIAFYRIMLLPARTDIRGAFSLATFPDGVEVPAGSGCFYVVEDVADAARGFSNEHRVAWLMPDAQNPIPFPMP